MIPEITIRKNNSNNNYIADLNKFAVDLIGSEEIVFDPRELRLRPSCFYDNKTLKISRIKTKSKYKEYISHCGSFGFSYYEAENILGKYTLEEKKRDLNFKINARNKYINDYRKGIILNSKIVAYTSISPTHAHEENQLNAISSWRNHGIEVYSLNNKSEIIQLRKKYPEWVNFIEAKKTSKHIFGKPCVMINEMMDHFYNNNTGNIIMLINSDIIINTTEELMDKIKSISEICVPISHRSNYESDINKSNKYEFGFDVFFIHKKYIHVFPQSIYSMGQTWWDYWIPYTALKNGIPVFIISNKLASHKEHPIQYNEKDWVKMTDYFKWENNIDIHGAQETTDKIISNIKKNAISYQL